MEITEVGIRLVEEEDRPNSRILAYCSIVIENLLVIGDIRVIKGYKGMIVAMPDRMLTDRCFSCKSKNGIRSEFCCQCGIRIDRTRHLNDGWIKTHKDIIHPKDVTFRREIESVILEAYQKELTRKSTISEEIQ